MIDWLCNKIFKTYIDELVDQRFRENVIERYFTARSEQLRKRTAVLRKTFDNSTQANTSTTKTKIQLDSTVRRGNTQSGIQTATAQLIRNKNE